MPDERLFTPLTRWRVVLVSPQNSENVGAVARLVMNFAYGGGLWIVNPQCDVRSTGEAGRLSRPPGHQILDSAHIVQTLEQALSGTTLSIATTMHQLEDRPCEIIGFNPTLISNRHLTGDAAIVFGREDNGLTNDECSLCTYRWAFSLNPEFPSMNLAQAVAAVSACIQANANLQEDVIDDTPSEIAKFNELDGLIRHVQEMLEAIDFERGVPIKYPLRLIRRLASRSELTISDVQVLRGVCRRVINATKKGKTLE
ncbi:MAG: RNA methyltransferase [Sumerlaeia bacterium]